jgi:hypothetical protein
MPDSREKSSSNVALTGIVPILGVPIAGSKVEVSDMESQAVNESDEHSIKLAPAIDGGSIDLVHHMGTRFKLPWALCRTWNVM